MDTAFEKARAAYGTGAYDDATLEFLFPQLKESEDERIRKWLIDYFKNVGNTWIHREISPEQIIAYLEKQKDHFRDDTKMVEQKPAEWSEEDEDMLNSCISSIEEAKENRYAYKETDGDTSYDHEIAWLESLRNRVGKESLQPHWKPSEEQMEALWEVEGRMRTNKAFTLSNRLASLYNDLQKLM